jgi:hypothetical protein
MLTEQKINTNYLAYIKRLEKYGVYSEEMMNDIGELVKNATFSMKDEQGGAYQGAMIDVVLNVLCKIGYEINEKAFGDNENMSHPLLKCNMDMLMRVLLLQHIAKCEMFVPERESYWIKKGNLYNWNENLEIRGMKLGERSIYLCQKYGIKLTETEYDAIKTVDKDEDEKSLFYISPLAAIVRAANMFTTVELRRRFTNNKKKETTEQ